ncbi:hypothetical protein KR054_002414 [Drosophila jambulina]|nr:hypothetical protein KR054_002414 [Drosophila jambulina]
MCTDQGTQTDCLLITEEEPATEARTDEQRLLDNGVNKTPLRKSASFSSSSTSSPGSSSLGSATSTMSLRSSTPLRSNHSHSSRALRSDTINTFQKWETTIESISYVSTKTVSISDFSKEPQLREQTGENL